jgi:hypothetical protein
MRRKRGVFCSPLFALATLPSDVLAGCEEEPFSAELKAERDKDSQRCDTVVFRP